MSANQARELLWQFKEDGAANIDHVRAVAGQSAVIADYRIETLPDFLNWAFLQLHTVPRESDIDVPDWIRSTPEYQRGRFDFDHDSKNLICFVAYYFGECFVRNFPQLHWTTGNLDYAEANMPVVTGFKGDIELAPMFVLENLYRRITEKPNRIGDLYTAIDTWRAYLE